MLGRDPNKPEPLKLSDMSEEGAKAYRREHNTLLRRVYNREPVEESDMRATIDGIVGGDYNSDLDDPGPDDAFTAYLTREVGGYRPPEDGTHEPLSPAEKFDRHVAEIKAVTGRYESDPYVASPRGQNRGYDGRTRGNSSGLRPFEPLARGETPGERASSYADGAYILKNHNYEQGANYQHVLSDHKEPWVEPPKPTPYVPRTEAHGKALENFAASGGTVSEGPSGPVANVGRTRAERKRKWFRRKGKQ